jgi:hypothetical protein
MIFDERIDQIASVAVNARCIDDIKDVLMPLTDEELEAAYECLLAQYGQELAEAAVEKSKTFRRALLIDGNQPTIGRLRWVLDAMRGEIVQRWTLALSLSTERKQSQ